MDTKFAATVIIFVILLSFQYTLNRILKELVEIKNILKKNTKILYREERRDRLEQEQSREDSFYKKRNI